MDTKKFKKIIWDHYREHKRDFPWRQTRDPYEILVSEIMLQQTQTDRVVPKYLAFLKKFPTARSLAGASSADVLRLWQGLGYNRRALMLQRAAQAIVNEHAGKVPQDVVALDALPGIGPYTAGAIAAFAYDTAVPIIETNIRRVYIHHFFPKTKKISDPAILKLVTNHLSLISDPRAWYYALMDYGSTLAKTMPNPNRRSRHYAKQSKFEGSHRQIRGRVLKLLLAGNRKKSELSKEINNPRFELAYAELKKEGFTK